MKRPKLPRKWIYYKVTEGQKVRYRKYSLMALIYTSVSHPATLVIGEGTPDP